MKSNSASFLIPASIAPDVREYANSHQITEDQAITQLLKAGLERAQVQSRRSIIGAFSSPEESAVIDKAVDIAMHDRERRNSTV